MLLGIMGAMPEEMNKIISTISNKEIIERGSRIYYKGILSGQEVVAVFSRWGKVAAATTATHLILEFKVDRIVFTGVAGGISPDLNIGDIVIGQHLYQHDMDARPLMRRFEIPLTGKTSYEIPRQNIDTMAQAVHNFLKNNKEFRKLLAEQRLGQCLHPMRQHLRSEGALLPEKDHPVIGRYRRGKQLCQRDAAPDGGVAEMHLR